MKNKKVIYVSLSLIFGLLLVFTYISLAKFSFEELEKGVTSFVSKEDTTLYYAQIDEEYKLEIKSKASSDKPQEILSIDNVYKLNNLVWNKDKSIGAISIDLIPENGLIIDEYEYEIPPRKLIIFKRGKILFEKESKSSAITISGNNLIIHNPVDELADSFDGYFEKINLNNLKSEKIVDYDSWDMIIKSIDENNVAFFGESSNEELPVPLYKLNIIKKRIEKIADINGLADFDYKENNVLITKQNVNEFDVVIFELKSKSENEFLTNTFNKLLDSFNNRNYYVTQTKEGQAIYKNIANKNKKITNLGNYTFCSNFNIVDKVTAYTVCDEQLIKINGNLLKKF